MTARPTTILPTSREELPALFEKLGAADLVVGFNSLRFDYAVLSAFAPFDLHKLPQP